MDIGVPVREYFVELPELPHPELPSTAPSREEIDGKPRPGQE
jgi:hypothetical protein